MAVKTITVQENAYEALKSLQLPRESFTQTILRISKRKSLNSFFGILNKEAGERLETAILNRRKQSNAAHLKRVKAIAEALRVK